MNIRQLGNPVGRAEFLESYNGGGPESVTSTTTSNPPSFLLPSLQSAVDDANRQMTQARSAPGSFPATQINNNAAGLVNSTLQGDFLGPESNPFLQQTFNKAADLTRGRLDTEFSGAGRNLGAAMPARSQELQTLASNLYGQNYQAERDRQITAVDQGQNLDPLNQFINRIAGIIPGAGGSTQSTQPVFRTGLF